MISKYILKEKSIFSNINFRDISKIFNLQKIWKLAPINKIKNLSSVYTEIHCSQNVTVYYKSVKKKSLKFYEDKDKISCFVWKYGKDVLELNIENNKIIKEEIRIRISSNNKISLKMQNIVINALQGSKSTIILEHEGSSSLYQNIEINVRENACLTLISIQKWNSDSIHLNYDYINIFKNAHFKHIIISLSGKMIKAIPSVLFHDSGGKVKLVGMYLNKDFEYKEHKIFIKHNHPSCISKVNYKGFLKGKNSKAVWIGNVYIDKNAKHTNTYQINKNLVFNSKAQFESIPNLEIQTGKIIQAGHATSTFNFDLEHLFYLQSRGISLNEAYRLIIYGFFKEIIDYIDQKSLKKKILSFVKNKYLSKDNLRSI